MNRINFTAKEDFPLSSDALELLQQIIITNASLALLGGSNYILSGCVDDGGNVSAGIVVIGGEVIPFQAGAKQTKITIEETTQGLTAFGVSYPESYVFRVAKFSVTGEYNWADFSQIISNKELDQRISNIKGDAPGIVKMWAGSVGKIPVDYILCDGRTLSEIDYPELFDIIGSTFGGDGNPDFNLPDLRGRFIVGYDNTDTDYNGINPTKTGGEKKHTLTIGETPSHNHTAVNSPFTRLSARASDVDSEGTIGEGSDTNSATTEYRVAKMTSPQWDLSQIQSVGGGMSHENRPPYFVLAYIIKVR